MTCNNSLANIGGDHVQDGSSKLANSDGNQNELKANEEVKAIETGIILLIDSGVAEAGGQGGRTPTQILAE